MVFLEVREVSAVKEGRTILKDITFSQLAFQKIALAGETGSGKSTLLKIIAGLEECNSGTVFFKDEPVEGAATKLVPGHQQIAYLPQYFELQKFLRVEQVLQYANKLSSASAKNLFKICQIDHLLKRKTHELSGGEKQRIALCRLLISQPKLLLLDEPFSNLDQIVKDVLKKVLDEVLKKLKITCILVSHDADDTLPWADEIFVLRNGKLVQQGKPTEVYFYALSKYVGGLFGKYSTLSKGLAQFFGFKDQTIFRPEQFKISNRTSAKAKQGKITDVLFFGSHQLIRISIDLDQLYAHEEIGVRRVVGDMVYISRKRIR